ALMPDKSNLKIIEVEKKKAAEERARRHEFLKQMAEKIAGAEVMIPAAANEEGHLYGSVGTKDISRALIGKGFSVQTEQMKLDDPIKNLDTMMVAIHLGEGLDTQVKVWVVPEKTAADLSMASDREVKGLTAEGKEPRHGADTGDSSKSGESSS